MTADECTPYRLTLHRSITQQRRCAVFHSLATRAIEHTLMEGGGTELCLLYRFHSGGQGFRGAKAKTAWAQMFSVTFQSNLGYVGPLDCPFHTAAKIVTATDINNIHWLQRADFLVLMRFVSVCLRFSVSVSVCLSACGPACHPACLSACLPVYLPACLLVFLPAFLSVCLPVCLSLPYFSDPVVSIPTYS